jgi:hypothetical protein
MTPSARDMRIDALRQVSNGEVGFKPERNGGSAMIRRAIDGIEALIAAFFAVTFAIGAITTDRSAMGGF